MLGDRPPYDTPDRIRSLANAIRERANAGRNSRLSPETALVIAKALEVYAMPVQISPPDRFHIDAYDKGSAIYRLDRSGEIFEVVAWAKNTLIALAAFDALVERNSEERFLQKRKSWVEKEG